MTTHNPIERAFEVAATATSIDEIRKVLRQEGYANVDAHLQGASIKADLRKRLGKARG
jgi:tRNA G26 N,N-dimethylase Trm1